MKKYSANYSSTNHNFVIQNLQRGIFDNTEIKPLLFVLKNLLQRGCPTVMSQFLQARIGSIHLNPTFNNPLVLAPVSPSRWYQTIKGGANGNPARDFFQFTLPHELGEYGFVQPLILPEVEINDITNEYTPEFVNQQVDFYLPQAKLVIEIDGQQHKLLDAQRISDNIRDAYLGTKKIKTIRISTAQLRNGQYHSKIQEIVARLQEFQEFLDPYRVSYESIFSESNIKNRLLPTAIIRFQILVIDLLLSGRLSLESEWKFNICCDEPITGFAELAIEDTLLWLEKLIQLRDKYKIIKPYYSVSVSPHNSYSERQDCVNVCFSLLKKYTDEHLTQHRTNTIYVSNDYFDRIEERDYFRASTTKSINYHITDDDRETLEFFLLNIFGKPGFREGQFPIVANALNQNDTIGLLPTGGGKSLCYQLPCLLQPSVNFVVCPIKSLMQDQRDNLVSGNVLINHVSYINGDMDASERQRTMYGFGRGHYLLLWVSPERFQIKDFRTEIKRVVDNLNISYAVIDEVHCLSEWGHDFRTSYLNLARTIDSLSPRDEYNEGTIKFIGLTATASVSVLNDIKAEFSRQRERLEEENIKSLLDYSRRELHFEVINDNGNKEVYLMQCVANDKFISSTRERSAIVFTPAVNGPKGCFTLSTNFNNTYPDESRWYSGGMPWMGGGPLFPTQKLFNEYKQQVQIDFKQNKFQIMFATKAFGMGIDKPNVFYTYHFGLPASVESLYQEAGRAGRWDKSKTENKDLIANCYVLYTPELQQNQMFVDEMLDPQTTFSRCRQIDGNIPIAQKKDVFTQFFLFQSGKLDIKQEYDRIINVINTFFAENTTKTISHTDIKNLNINTNDFEQVIYRLTLLGIAKDWTRDFKTSFEVEFTTLDEEKIIESVASYINKHEHELDVHAAIESVNDFCVRCWWAFALAGTVLLVLSLFISNIVLSSILGVLGCAFLWSIFELFEQRKRVKKGWFPQESQT